MKAKSIIKKALTIKENETFEDGILRLYYRHIKRNNKKSLSIDKFRKKLELLGLTRGDTVIVHCSWRALYMLDFSPRDMIDLLIEMIGDEGNVLMPSYGHDDSFFDECNTKSKAGVLSEEFRNYKGVSRSIFPKFSMCAYGKKSFDLLNKHKYSKYQFDSMSPYQLAMNEYNAKVLLLGFTKKPHKISAIHCASYNCKDYIKFYNECYRNKKKAIIKFSNGFEEEITYFDRLPNYINNKRIFRKIYDKTKKKRIKLGMSSYIHLFKSKDVYDVAYEFCISGGKIYNNIKEKK